MSETLEFTEVDFQDPSDLELFDPEVAARELLGYAMEAGASDLFITDEPYYVTIRMRRLGRIEPLQNLSREAGRRLQNHFRAVGGADVTDQMKPVEGRNLIQIDDARSVDIRISALPSVFGQDLALRIFNSDQSLMDIDQLGFLTEELSAIRGLLDSSCGLLLVSGPTGSGKTSSLYSFLRYLNRGDSKIHTLEEPVEYTVPGIVQSQVNVRAGIDYSQLLYAILRHAPDVIMIGEIRDQRTAEIAVRAGGSGQFVLATVHARTAVGAIQTMSAYGINPHFLASSLTGVISQRLIRRLCPACRFEVDVSDVGGYLADVQPLLSGDQNASLFMPEGCDDCLSGYDRLTCVPEILKVNKEFRRAIADRVDYDRLEQIARDSGMLPFRRAAQLRLATGVTTVEEIVRVLPEEETGSHFNQLDYGELTNDDADICAVEASNGRGVLVGS